MTADKRLALVRLKIERANKHIDDLQAEIRFFLDSNPYKIETKRNPDTRQMIYYVVSADPVPANIALIIGDILHCLRDALDHLAQQLYLVGTGDTKGYGDHIGFPIVSRAKDFKSCLLGKVQDMGKNAINAIRALEPYPGGQGADLWTFHRLNNIDKHRLIVTVGSSFRSVGLGPIMERMFKSTVPAEQFASMEPHMKTLAADLFIRPADDLFPLKAGDELLIDTPDSEPHQDMQFRFEVVIHEPGVIEGKPILETLIQFRDRVSGIIEAFRPCLS
jgi:hypothetical protein